MRITTSDWRTRRVRYLVRLGHRRIRRPMFPFDPEMAEPDLAARIIPPSDAQLTGEDE
ncbi:hypothetical protein [Streptomyces sp. NBC_00996]|uniref:hypothetical protein n=1 Tax=Streptomyces sp. NBC_00996 TaxID=2903710 RepID=UPI00386B17D8|nr:hypothetical protein OG390_04255 [Streptomyces sp. NBC_00996]